MSLSRSSKSPRLWGRSRNGSRRGLSILEFVGCAIAMIGGIWLGAIWLGVDVRHEAEVALAESELMEQVPANWRPVEVAKKTSPTEAQLAESAQQELAALRSDITALKAATQGSPDAEVTASETNEAKSGETVDAESQTKAATLAYWARLHEIVENEIAMQRDAESVATAGNATRLAAIKGRINQFTATSIRALPKRDVDLAAAALGKELAGWYEQGAVVYDEAVRVWESSAGSNNSTDATKAWEQSQTQHRNEGQLLTGRAAGIRDSLTRQFGEGFAPFPGL